MSSVATAAATSSSSSAISPSESFYVASGCLGGLRSDGRGPAQYRPYALDVRSFAALHNGRSLGGRAEEGATSVAAGGDCDPPLALSHGSSRLTLPGSDTDILCSVRAELVRPAPSRPDRGIIDVRVELLHSGSGSGSGSVGSSRSKRAEEAQLSAALNRLVAPYCADRAGMCILPGRYAWRLAVDVSVLSADGNVLDACGMAVRAAVRGTVLPQVTAVGRAGGAEDAAARPSDELLIDGDLASGSPPPGSELCPILVTVFVLDRPPPPSMSPSSTPSMSPISSSSKSSRVMILDARSEEEQCASAMVSAAVDPAGRICGVYKHSGGGTLPLAALVEATAAATEGARRVTEILDDGSAVCARGGEDLLGECFKIQ